MFNTFENRNIITKVNSIEIHTDKGVLIIPNPDETEIAITKSIITPTNYIEFKKSEFEISGTFKQMYMIETS